MAQNISPNTTIKELLKNDGDNVIAALVKLNANFSKLKNPVLRNLMSKRVTIAGACKIAGCTLQDFMDTMRGIGFNIAAEIVAAETEAPVQNLKKASAFTELDVRPILAENRDPLKTILAAINNLKGDMGLKLINTFEPVPLIHLLSEKGFTHFVIKPDNDTVITYFNRVAPGPDVSIASLDRDYADSLEAFDATLKKFGPGRIESIDVRNLDMPGPMVTILKALKDLKEDMALLV